MSDFSLFSLFTAGFACLLPLTAAYTQPTGDQPTGNPIYQPGLNAIVPAGQAYNVTWQPTTPGTVTLLLLKGPANNVVPLYPIAENIANSGSFMWTPATDLAPANTGYALELIVDATGQYQYTTQFGISNDNYQPSGSASASGSASVTSGTSIATSTTIASSATVTSGSTTLITSTGAPFTNGTQTTGPTGSLSTHSSLQTKSATATGTATGSATAGGSSGSATASSSVSTQSGAAAGMATNFAGLVVAAGMAVFAL